MLRAPQRMLLTCAIVIAIGTLAVYSSAFQAEFVNYDDGIYVSDNEMVKHGLTWDGARWAFTTGTMSNWHPLTWLSHMLDVQVFGLKAGAHHAVNVALHIINSLLLLWLLFIMTGAAWRSALVAALFAWHPLHVESVAWIAERKDVLSTCLGLLSLLAYVDYARRGGALRYVLCAGLLGLGLMSKPMLVTWPCVMVLLDFWPLGRLRRSDDGGVIWGALPRLLIEKGPLFVLVAASCVTTVIAQSRGGAVVSGDEFPLLDRFANAAVSYVTYLKLTVWPKGLAIIYPYAGPPALWQAGLCAALLSAITIAAWLWRRSQPSLLIGWLWYVGTLVPVIGLVQVGNQALADRYTYIPLIGIFVAGVWSIPAPWLISPRLRLALATCAGGFLLILGIISWRQAQYWQSSATLWERALAATSGNFIAHNNYGLTLEQAGQEGAALEHYRAAAALHANYYEAHYNAGITLFKHGNYSDALPYLTDAAQLRCGDPTVPFLIGVALVEEGRPDLAVGAFREAIRLNPDYAEAHDRLARVLQDR